MFYSTLYIGDLYKRAFFATAILMPPPEITEDSLAALDTEATRIGSRALFYSSVLCLFMNIVLPFFVTEASSSSRRRKQERQRGVRFAASGSYEPHGAQNGLDELAQSPTSTRPVGGPWWRNLAIPEIFKVRLASLWAVSLGVLACCMLATLCALISFAVSRGLLVLSFTSSVTGGMFLITMTGFSWAVTQWVPFALVCRSMLSSYYS
jgi:solute carrier family 45 protein 1/2/4